MKMKDIDTMSVDQIIRLPFFLSLERDVMGTNTQCWKITFRYNKVLSIGLWGLLDAESESEYITRYKLIEPNYDK